MSANQQIVYYVSCLTSLFFWVSSYLLLIRRAFKDHVYGMPLIPLCVNISYEFIFGILHPDKPPLNYANIAWFFIDLVIVYQYLRFGKQEFTNFVSPKWFAPACLLALATAFAGVLTLTYDLKDWQGNYSGWGDQLLISVSFIYLLIRRRSVKGQSLYIALSRMIGTLALIPAQYLLTPRSKFLAFIYVAFLVFDLIYVTLLARQCREEGINPWKRV
jgi:hypothetical protein